MSSISTLDADAERANDQTGERARSMARQLLLRWGTRVAAQGDLLAETVTPITGIMESESELG